MIVMLQMDRLAVALAGQASGLTYYVVPASLASRLNVVGGPSATLFFARASALHAEGSAAELVRQHSQAVRFLLWTAVALSVPLIAIGPAFLRVWIAPEMAARGGPILTVLAVGYCLSSIGSVYAATLEATGHPDWTAKNMLCWSIPALLGVWAGIPRYGCLAIAFGVAGWQCCAALTNLILCRRLGLEEPTKAWRGAAGTALLSIAAGMLLRIWISSVLIGLAAMCVLGMIALAVGAAGILSAADRSLLLALSQRSLRYLNHFRSIPKPA